MRADPRTIALLLVVPCVLIGLLAWIYNGTPSSTRSAPPLLGVFPFVVMFLVTSVATLRERTSGTLERLLTTPLGKGDFLVRLRRGLRCRSPSSGPGRHGLRGLGVRPRRRRPGLAAASSSPSSTRCSAPPSGCSRARFARTEFQAVQFMPAFVLPQFLLCGLLVPRDALPRVLCAVSDLLPLSYAVDAMQTVTVDARRGVGTWPATSRSSRLRRRRARPRVAARCGAARPEDAPAHGV